MELSVSLFALLCLFVCSLSLSSLSIKLFLFLGVLLRKLAAARVPERTPSRRPASRAHQVAVGQNAATHVTRPSRAVDGYEFFTSRVVRRGGDGERGNGNGGFLLLFFLRNSRRNSFCRRRARTDIRLLLHLCNIRLSSHLFRINIRLLLHLFRSDTLLSNQTHHLRHTINPRHVEGFVFGFVRKRARGGYDPAVRRGRRGFVNRRSRAFAVCQKNLVTHGDFGPHAPVH
mmetsp:Transcript_6989/g.26402  ORF Transcript_6989/g.26402 Transcript_6989/m.26402 type:complete len:230 (+) Transcript_6989:139-828(+)